MDRNEDGLPYLDQGLLDLLFGHVYGGSLEEIADEETRDFVSMLGTMQHYNYRHRPEQFRDLFPLFERAVGPMEANSEGTSFWLALGLAIKELYGMRPATLERLMRQVRVRK